MCCNLFHGDPKKTCGTMSSGGSDSLFLACKAYMFYARKEKGIMHPNIVMPVSYIVFKMKKYWASYNFGIAIDSMDTNSRLNCITR